MPVKFQVRVSMIKLLTLIVQSLKETLITSYEKFASNANNLGLSCDLNAKNESASKKSDFKKRVLKLQ